MPALTNKQLIEALQQEPQSFHPVVVSDDWCLGVHYITEIRYNRNCDRIEIVCNNQ